MKILKIPLNAGALSKKDGQDLAPDAIVKKLKDFYLKEDGNIPVFDIIDINVNNSDIIESNDNISKAVSSLNFPAILLGGDHSITYSSFSAFAKKFKNPGIIIFDAHLDCENDFSPPTHEDYLRVLINEGHLKPENAIIVGVRNMHSNEKEYAKSKKLKIFSMKKISEEGAREVCDYVMENARQFDGLYLSVDIDAADPAFASGTGYIEPGGLTSRELLYFLQRIKLLKNLKLIDVVEVNPKKDFNEITVLLAAKIIVELS
ncbi:MAG: arginase family protein [archaeon]